MWAPDQFFMPATDRPDMFDHLWRTAPREVWTERRAPADGAEEFATRFSVQGDGRVGRRRGEMLLDTARCATLCRVPAPYGPSPKRSNGVTRGARRFGGLGAGPVPSVSSWRARALGRVESAASRVVEDVPAERPPEPGGRIHPTPGRQPAGAGALRTEMSSRGPDGFARFRQRGVIRKTG
jgi:hypothetical protein